MSSFFEASVSQIPTYITCFHCSVRNLFGSVSKKVLNTEGIFLTVGTHSSQVALSTTHQRRLCWGQHPSKNYGWGQTKRVRVAHQLWNNYFSVSSNATLDHNLLRISRLILWKWIKDCILRCSGIFMAYSHTGTTIQCIHCVSVGMFRTLNLESTLLTDFYHTTTTKNPVNRQRCPASGWLPEFGGIQTLTDRCGGCSRHHPERPGCRPPASNKFTIR